MLEQLDVLEGARDAEAGDPVRRQRGDIGAVEHQPALGRAVVAADQVEHRGLAGTVRPDDGEAIAFGNVKTDPVDGADAADSDGETVGLEQRGHRTRSDLVAGLWIWQVACLLSGQSAS